VVEVFSGNCGPFCHSFHRHHQCDRKRSQIIPTVDSKPYSQRPYIIRQSSISLHDIRVHRGIFGNTFVIQQLDDLPKCLTEPDRMTFGPKSIRCRKLVYDYPQVNNIPYVFNHYSEVVQMDCLRYFVKTKNFRLRVPEATSDGRVQGFNHAQFAKLSNY
jgi:hypothetical protein